MHPRRIGRGGPGMDAHAFFEMLDAEWEATISQYVGYARGFVVEKQTMRVTMRVLAGTIHVCFALAEHIVSPEEAGRLRLRARATRRPRALRGGHQPELVDRQDRRGGDLRFVREGH